jgi:hypothetical protein
MAPGSTVGRAFITRSRPTSVYTRHFADALVASVGAAASPGGESRASIGGGGDAASRDASPDDTAAAAAQRNKTRCCARDSASGCAAASAGTRGRSAAGSTASGADGAVARSRRHAHPARRILRKRRVAAALNTVSSVRVRAINAVEQLTTTEEGSDGRLVVVGPWAASRLWCAPRAQHADTQLANSCGKQQAAARARRTLPNDGATQARTQAAIRGVSFALCLPDEQIVFREAKLVESGPACKLDHGRRAAHKDLQSRTRVSTSCVCRACTSRRHVCAPACPSLAVAGVP